MNQIIKVTEKWHLKIHTNERISLFNKDVHILGMCKPFYHPCSQLSAYKVFELGLKQQWRPEIMQYNWAVYNVFLTTDDVIIGLFFVYANKNWNFSSKR